MSCLTSSGDGWSLGSSCVGGSVAGLSIPVTTSCFQHLLCPAFCLRSLSVCSLWSLRHHPPLPLPALHPSTHSRLILSSLFCAFSLFPCLRLVFFPCQRLSKQSRVCVCVCERPRNSAFLRDWELSKEHSCVFIRRPCSAFSRYLPEAPVPFFVLRVWPCAFSERPA